MKDDKIDVIKVLDIASARREKSFREKLEKKIAFKNTMIDDFTSLLHNLTVDEKSMRLISSLYYVVLAIDAISNMRNDGQGGVEV